MARCVESKLNPKDYKRILRSKFHSPLAIFSERVTGIFVGPFFSIAYYSPYEWNRRITNECNRAFGRIKEVDGKTQVYFIYGKGLLSPSWLLFFFGLFSLFFITAYMDLFSVVACLIGSLLLSVFICGVTAIQDSLTEAGEQGVSTLTYLLQEPDQFYYW